MAIIPKNSNVLSIAFCIAVTGGVSLQETQAADIPYKKMGDADIYIPIKEYRPINDKTLLIKISDRKISPLNYLFSKMSAFSADGYNKDRTCPYVKFKDKDYSIKKIGRHDYEITVRIPPELKSHLKNSGCIITPTPSLSKITRH